jgi:CarboxypepD_reg-like domain
MTPSTFSCSFSNLGDVVRLGWFEYQQYESRFAAHKPSKYIPTYGEDNLKLLQDFLDMDDYSAHETLIQALRVLFVNEVKGVSMSFKTLKNYIGGLTTDKTKLVNYYKDAGQQLYDDRKANDLADNDKVLVAMIRFVQNNQAVLLEKDLPTNFVQQLKDKQTNLAATNKAWLDEKTLGSTASETKTIAGNDLKARLSNMFLDAQIIFQEEKEIAKKFVWDTLLTQVRGERDTGLIGKVMNKVTEKGASNVTISIPSLNLSTVSDATGRYELLSLPAGTHNIEAKGEGFKTQVIEKRFIKPNTMGRLTFEMELE